jgi:hypothetical protein
MIVLMDGDDYFTTDEALQRIAKEYRNPDCWVTYGSFRGPFAHVVNDDVPPEVTGNEFRAHRWVYGPPRTFRKFLVDHVSEETLKRKDKWLRTATDAALFYPILELAGAKRVRRIPDVLYHYREHQHNTFHDPTKGLMKKHVRSMPPYQTLPHAETVSVVIHTYQRPKQLVGLLTDLKREARGWDVSIRVYDDASTADYGEVRQLLEDSDDTYHRASSNHGLHNHWQWFNRALQDLKSEDADFYLFVQDDMRLCNRFFERLLSVWMSIPDPNKAALNPLVDRARVHSPCWTGVLPQAVGDAELTGWVDGAFLCERRLLEELNFAISPIPLSRWQKNPLLSSGVGQDISTRLQSRGLGLYRAKESLVAHVSEESCMHPDTHIDTIRFVDGPEALDRFSRQLEEE